MLSKMVFCVWYIMLSWQARKALGKFPKALYGTTGGTCSIPKALYGTMGGTCSVPKGWDTRCDKIAATSRLVCTVAATSRLPLFCRCDMSHEFKPVWIRATDRSDKFCCSDNDFYMSHEAICCSNLLRRFVASCVSAIRLCIGQREVLAVHDFSVLSWLTYQENYQNGLMTRKWAQWFYLLLIKFFLSLTRQVYHTVNTAVSGNWRDLWSLCDQKRSFPLWIFTQLRAGLKCNHSLTDGYQSSVFGN